MKKISLFVVLGILLASAQAFAVETWPDLNHQVTDFYQKQYYTKAIPVAERALALAEKQYGPNSAETALSLNNLAMLYAEKGDWPTAQNYSIRAMSVIEGKYGVKHPLSVQARQRYYQMEKKYKK